MLNTKQINIIKSMQAKWPVHIIPIAEKFGLSVYKVATFQDSLSGLIKMDDENNDSYSIYVNSSHPVTRQRFTMAHELAHFLLHRDQIGDGIVDDYLYRSKMTSKIEREANMLASEILIPDNLLKKAKKEFPNRTISGLADMFWVSQTSMDIRLGSTTKYLVET